MSEHEGKKVEKSVDFPFTGKRARLENSSQSHSVRGKVCLSASERDFFCFPISSRESVTCRGGESGRRKVETSPDPPGFSFTFMTYYTPTRLVVSLGKMTTAANSHPSNVYDIANGELFVGILVILSSVVREIKEKNGIQLDITVASE